MRRRALPGFRFWPGLDLSLPHVPESFRQCFRAAGDSQGSGIQSSSKVRRGFCGDCGTPLTYEFEGNAAEIAICTLDDPSVAAPVIQVGLESRIPWCEGLDRLPTRTPQDAAKVDAIFKELVSCQHPDRDTQNWPPVNGGEKA